MPPRLVARQLAHPSGIFGRIVGLLMNRHNAAMNRYAVTQLRVQNSDRVLEIGFGGGVALSLLVGSTSSVEGLDPSAEMVKWAKMKYSANVRGGRAAFREGRVEALPYSPGSFEKVYTVNSVYFWASLGEGFEEIYRVLAAISFPQWDARASHR